jgi:hypothetical protein
MTNQNIDSETKFSTHFSKKRNVILHIALGALTSLVLFALFHGNLIYKYQLKPEGFLVTPEVTGRYFDNIKTLQKNGLDPYLMAFIGRWARDTGRILHHSAKRIAFCSDSMPASKIKHNQILPLGVVNGA